MKDITITCDRCGATYKQRDEATGAYLDPHLDGMRWLPARVEVQASNGATAYDLCGRCVYDVHRWLKAKP